MAFLPGEGAYLFNYLLESFVTTLLRVIFEHRTVIRVWSLFLHSSGYCCCYGKLFRAQLWRHQRNLEER